MSRSANNNRSLRIVVKSLITRLVLLGMLTTSVSSLAGGGPPTIDNCDNRWRLDNITTGMSFGDFSVEGTPGTITLNAGSSRTGDSNIDLVSAGSPVNSHKITVSNRKSDTCGTFPLEFSWSTDPADRDMTGPDTAIDVHSAKLYIPSIGTYTLPTGIINLPTLPVDIEIIANMTTSGTQTSGAYSSGNYRLVLTQNGVDKARRGSSDTFSINPMVLTPGVAMDFGQIASGSTGGALVMDTAGARSVASGDADVVSNAVSGTAGTFTIQGDPGLTFSISYINGSLTDTLGGNAMTITGFTDTSAGLILSGGADPFSVGASLILNGAQSAGYYSTTNPGGVPYSITVNYD